MKMHHSPRRTDHKTLRARNACFLLLALTFGAGGMSLAHADDAACPKHPCQQKQSPPEKPQRRIAPIADTQVSHAPTTGYSTQPPHALIKEKIPTVGPGSPGPTHTTTSSSSAASKQGIIFVGGKNALNPQPIPPGHSSTTPGAMPTTKPGVTTSKPLPTPDPHAH